MYVRSLVCTYGITHIYVFFYLCDVTLTISTFLSQFLFADYIKLTEPEDLWKADMEPFVGQYGKLL